MEETAGKRADIFWNSIGLEGRSRAMMKRLEQLMAGLGYRFCRIPPEEATVFYKYWREGFHVVMAVDFDHIKMTPEWHREAVNRVMDFFYHPNGRLADFPEGFAVYHVECLTLLIGGSQQEARRMCSVEKNVWAYLTEERRLLVYENQPGEFFGLRAAIEGEWVKPYQAARRLEIKRLPLSVIAITAINVFAYLILEVLGDTRDGSFIAEHGGMYPEYLIYQHQWWRLLTAMFLHFGLEHLLNNMVIFCCVGSRLERAAGHIRLLLIYVLSGLGGGFLSFLMMAYSGDYAVSAGASGAVFGTIGGLLWAVIRHKGRFEGLTVRGLAFMLALSLYYGFSTMGVDNWCHIGGMATGFVTAAILYHGKVQNC